MTEKSGEQALALIRHDAAHVLAAAVMELWPGVKISIGPAIENGFYYDFEFPEGVSISEEDFPAIEARMREHVRAAERFERVDVTPAEARERFVAEDQAYKVELIDDLVANAAQAVTGAEAAMGDGAGEGGDRSHRSRRSRSTRTARSRTSAAARTRRARRASARSS